MFARWKLAIVLEGSYAKFLRGESKKPVHEYFGQQADLLLASTLAMVDGRSRWRSPGDFELDADEIVAAAIVILQERGLDAVSMRNVADRLGVSPMPSYTRVGNKAALIDAVADHLLVDLAPAAGAASRGPSTPERWCRELRERLKLTPDSRLYLGAGREAYVEASRPLVAALRDRRLVERGRGAGVPPPDVGDGRLRGHGTGIERAGARRTGPVAASPVGEQSRGGDPGGGGRAVRSPDRDPHRRDRTNARRRLAGDTSGD